MVYREPIEWCDLWVAGAEDEGLPRCLLVGDSIARSYYAKVDAALQGRFACARLTTSKCVCDPAFARELDVLLADYEFAVIHFNNGLHGWDYDEATYADGLTKILDALRECSPETALIWASTTPVRVVGALAELDEKTDRVRERNRLAAEYAAARGLPINDLFGLVVPHPEYFGGDGVHFNERGQAVLGDQVVQSVLASSALIK